MIEVSEKSSRMLARGEGPSPGGDNHQALAMRGPSVRAWKNALIEDLNRSTVRNRLARGLAGVGCIHMASFLLCQAMYNPDGRADLRHPLLWLLELAAVLVFLRISLGRDWTRSSEAINLVAKLWTTFLILSFNLVTLNAMTGFELAWYKPVWATLSTFLFASLAWLFSPWFLVPAVQMWLTGLLIINLPDWAFLIYGVSWWLALMGIAFRMERRRLPWALLRADR